MTKTRKTNQKTRFKAFLKWLFVRPKGLLMLLFYRHIGVVALSKVTVNKKGELEQQIHSANNLKGKLIYIVPLDPYGIDKVIKNLLNIQQDLIHKSKHHDGVTMRKVKGGRRS